MIVNRPSVFFSVARSRRDTKRKTRIKRIAFTFDLDWAIYTNIKFIFTYTTVVNWHDLVSFQQLFWIFNIYNSRWTSMHVWRLKQQQKANVTESMSHARLQARSHAVSIFLISIGPMPSNLCILQKDPTLDIKSCHAVRYKQKRNLSSAIKRVPRWCLYTISSLSNIPPSWKKRSEGNTLSHITLE